MVTSADRANLPAMEERIEFGAPFTWFTDQPDHDLYAQEARKWIDQYVFSKSYNAVFMDTTTIQSALSLLQGNSSILTPMTLLDLANVVSALIVNDNIFHLENSWLDSISFNELLGNEPIFIPIPINPQCPPAVGSLTIGHWKHSRLYLTKLAHPESPYPEDSRAIKNAWETILGPGSNWENWYGETVEFVNRHYGRRVIPQGF
jgi:hypothetical protein